MNRSAVKMLCICILCAALMPSRICAETEASFKTVPIAKIPVPRLVKAKLSGVGTKSKLVLTLPIHRDGKFAGFKPKLLSVERCNFYNSDGKLLGAEEVAAVTSRMTAVFLIDNYDGDFAKDIAAVRKTASLSRGGKIAVVSATQSSNDRGSGGAIATINALGLEDTFPACHTAADQHGWLGRNDINKGFQDPDRYGWLHYDLGAEYSLCGLRFWNYNYAQLIQRAVRDVDVYVSNDPDAMGDNGHASWKAIADLDNIPKGPIPQGAGHLLKVPYRSDHVIAEPTDARYVRLDVQRNWGNGWNTGLSEVQFFARPDEPIFVVTSESVGPIGSGAE